MSIEDLLLLFGRQRCLLEFFQVAPVDLPPLEIGITSEVVIDQVVELVGDLVINDYCVEAFDNPLSLSSTDLTVAGIFAFREAL